MKTEICSRKDITRLIETGFPENTAVISFYTPRKGTVPTEDKINFEGVCENVFYVGIHDVDLQIIEDYGYTYETYLSQSACLAEFIYNARVKGLDIICQCDFGQSRSAACAAAILQHFEKRGIDIFADYRYYPNQLVYHKVFAALEKHKQEQNG